MRWQDSKQRRPTFACAAALSALGLLSAAEPALAQGRERIVAPPPQARIQRARPETLAPAIATAPTPVSRPGEALFDLNVQYTEAKIYNPATDSEDAVRLRSYRDVRETAPPKVPFVAPTVEVFPGETVRITLHNKLPKQDPSCPAPDGRINTPHCFNSTNLHAHGLWVSPSGNSDNVLLRINPSVDFQYEYNVPLDHPAGTFWYHPHLHGSTAVQVASGMAGVLVVRGSRLPESQGGGDIDTLLRNADNSPLRERVVLLQQVQYSCRDANNGIKRNADGTYKCEGSDVGGIESFADDQFGPQTWGPSGRYTSINGEVFPTFAEAEAGRIERWRVVHAGVREAVKLQFRKMRTGAPEVARLSAAQQGDWMAQNCPGEPLPQFGVANDGLTRAQMAQQTVAVLQPGYRVDLLMVFPEPGDYCVTDEAAPAESNVNGQAKSRKFLGKVSVAAGQPVAGDLKAYIQARLLEAADRTMPISVRQAVRDDLANDLSLRLFAAHRNVEDAEVTGRQSLEFKIGGGFQVDGKPYDPTRIDRVLPLGGVEEWTLTSFTNPPVGHPFHIHVNAFQIKKILNRQGEDVVNGEPNDPLYAGLKDVWKDTIFVKPGYRVVMRTRYQRYIGDFVLHCHILDHEDQGMMQNIRIAIPDGAGGVTTGHH
jgi:FtsP/CotA-like multicopper oxidase with cupredoxin domain